MKDKYYLVSYFDNDYSRAVDVFVTKNKITGDAYCNKFNTILKKWKNYYSQFEIEACGIRLLSDDYVNLFNRWSRLNNRGICICVEIEFRK